MIYLTDEQKSVIYHPLGKHAKILAVAGSGKTSTLVYRVKHLIHDRKIPPSHIHVLMFNKLARIQFKEKMTQIGIPLKLQPRVDTFHSFALTFIHDMERLGETPVRWKIWEENQARYMLKRVIETAERNLEIPANILDVDEAYHAIQLWKASLIPPPRAGHTGNKFFPKIYSLYEEERLSARALTYSDFIPFIVAFLEHRPELLGKQYGRLQHLIIDEYQDINYGQQRLIELLASNNADVMVVGDDDQTIYEWRGARPNYIIHEFQSTFTNKPIEEYRLSRSFRFGPVIAQCAYNTISFNKNRVQKPLISHNLQKDAHVLLFDQTSIDSNKALAEQVVTLVKDTGVAPTQIIVLCRIYAQLSGIESEFINKKIPYRIIGQNPFFKRREVVILLDYLWLAIHYHDIVDEETKKKFLNIANIPNRMLATKDLETLMNLAQLKEISLSEALETWIKDSAYMLNKRQSKNVFGLAKALKQAHKLISSKVPTESILSNLISSIDYLTYLDNYYGEGELSFDRKETIANFLKYTTAVNLPPLEFLAHISNLDTTRGAPEEQQIIMTTVFRTKGLEYEHVIIPNCNEGYMPHLHTTENYIYDTTGESKNPQSSTPIENERRLFYVAITRAKEAVYIGTTDSRKNYKPSRFIDEIQYQPTFKIISALQHIALGEKGARQKFLYLVQQFAGIKNLMQNLIEHYLPNCEDKTLLEEVKAIVATKDTTPFKYRFTYSYPQKENQPNLHPAWKDVK